MGKHDKACTNCKGTGERLIMVPAAVAGMEAFELPDGQDVLVPTRKIVDCMICGGTGLVEFDIEYDER